MFAGAVHLGQVLQQFWADWWDAWPLFADAALTATAAGALLGGLGVFVLLGRMIFMSAALGQLAGLGVALGLLGRSFLWRLPTGLWWARLAPLCPDLGALLGTGLGALLLASGSARPGRTGRRGRDQADASLGLLFVLGSAGTLVVANQGGVDLHDIHDLLTGSAVAVPPQARRRMTALCLWVLSGVALLLPPLFAAWLDPEGARVRGLPGRSLRCAVLLGLTAAIALASQLLGALPVFALNWLPAHAAISRCQTPVGSFVLAALLGALAGFVGYAVAFALDWPVGATQALAAACLAAFAAVLPSPEQAWAGPAQPRPGAAVRSSAV